MDETQVAPTEVVAEPEQPVAAPPPEQAQQTTAADQPTTDKGLLAAYTQGQQKLSAIAQALGISKTSTTEQFVTAIAARQQAPTAAEDELDQDPRVAQRLEAIRRREQAIAQQQYGSAADLAATLLDAAKMGAGILELSEVVNQHVLDAAAARFGGAPAQAGGTSPAPQQPQQPPTTPEQAIAAQAPERELDAEFRGNAGMFDPGITPDRSKGPEGFFRELMGKVSPRIGGTAPR